MTFPQEYVERNVGASTYISVDMTDHLAAGETISTVTWTPDDASMTELVDGTSAISGVYASARFEYLKAGFTRIEVVVITATPTERHVVYVLLQQLAAPVI